MNKFFINPIWVVYEQFGSFTASESRREANFCVKRLGGKEASRQEREVVYDYMVLTLHFFSFEY